MNKSDYSSLTYEVVKAGKVLGTRTFSRPLYGKSVTLPYFRENGKVGKIEIPLKWRMVSYKGSDVLFKVYLDVSRKSERQISIILNYGR